MDTERLLIRRFEPADWRDLYEYLSLEAVVRYEPYGVYTEQGCRDEAARRARQEAFWAVCLKQDGKLIGNLYFEQQEPREFMTWELGYVFNPAFGGKGYATESARRMLQYGFETLGAHRVVALCNPENTPSWRLMERLGMRREGHFLKKAWFKADAAGKPIWHDAYEYAMLDEEWARPTALNRATGAYNPDNTGSFPG